MTIVETEIPGVMEIHPRVLRDERGAFTKTFEHATFAARELGVVFAEEYHTVSRQNVLRGLHFQRPPADHAKIVYCVAGEVLDAAVDLRAGSPTFGRHLLRALSPETGLILYLPPGLAHGFYVRRGDAVLVYKVTSAYAPEHDAGILWSSAGIAWPCAEPLLSQRDRGFATLSAFETPFRYDPRRRT